MGLELVELVMEIERRFGITIDDHDAPRLATAGDLAQLVETQLEALGRRCTSADAVAGEGGSLVLHYGDGIERASRAVPIPREQIWPIVRALIARTFDVPEERVLPESPLSDDLFAG